MKTRARFWMGVVGAAGSAALVGCSSSPGQSSASAIDAGEPVDAVSLSSEREAAFAMLERLAASNNPLVRANVIESLARVGSRGEGVIRDGLRDPNPGVRSVAAMVAGRLGQRSLAGELRVLEHDPEARVRASALFALHEVGLDPDLTPLSVMLLSAPDMNARAQAAFVLGELGEPSAMGLLRQGIRAIPDRTGSSSRRLLELQIAEALVKLGDETALQTIRSALYPARPEELEATALAVQIIGEVGDKASIDQLIYLSAYLGDGNQKMPAEVRLAVADALAKMGERDGGFIAEEYAGHTLDSVRAQAAVVFGRTQKPAHLAVLRAMMEDDSEVVRVAAASGMLETSSALTGG